MIYQNLFTFVIYKLFSNVAKRVLTFVNMWALLVKPNVVNSRPKLVVLKAKRNVFCRLNVSVLPAKRIRCECKATRGGVRAERLLANGTKSVVN